MTSRRPILLIASTFAIALGCAHTAPSELLSARSVYGRAAEGPAKKYTPAELHVARESLAQAEAAFRDDGDTTLVRDQAYIAQRKSELAEVLARIVMLQRGIAFADEREDELHAEDAARTKSELAATKGNLATTQGSLAAEKAAGAASEKELEAERVRRVEAEERARRANADLARIASVKHEERGTVITLSGSVLFASAKYTLLPAAMAKLSQVSDALLKGDPNVTFVVEGHTDSQGKASANQELSVRRANAVRTELIAQGISADRITSEGHGSDRSIADNSSAEGRANNRRVEIVVRPGPG